VEEALAAYRLDPRAFGPAAKRPAESPLVADESARPSRVTQRHLVRDRTTHHGRRQFAERRAVLAKVASGLLQEKEVGHVPQ
jgi:hypothetical protein